MIHGSAAIINQGGGFLEQSRQGQCWPEKGTQFCSKQHLACEIGPRPAQLATRPVFWPPVLGPGFSGRAPGAPNRVPGSSTRELGRFGRSSGHVPGSSARELLGRELLARVCMYMQTRGAVTGPRYTGHGSGRRPASRAAKLERPGRRAGGLGELGRPA
jgi:hypothetical protein